MAKRQILTDNQFREAAKADAAPDDVQIRKGFITEIRAAEGAARALEFVISTASVDRMGDTIAVDGWSLANFRKNPVVLWAHDSGCLPVAKASNIRIEDGKLKARAEFMAPDLSEFSDCVYRCLKDGFLSATSVGFSPIKYAFSEEDGRTWGIDFLEQELLEFSIVPIPANPEALIEARAAGVDIAPLRAWAEKMLGAEGIATMPRKLYEAITKLPDELRSIADKLPAAAKGHRGQIRRCANIVAKTIKGETSAAIGDDVDETPPSAEDATAEAAAAAAAIVETDKSADPVESALSTPRLTMARRRLDLARRKLPTI